MISPDAVLARWARLQGWPAECFVGRWSTRAPRRAGHPVPVWVTVHDGQEGCVIEARQISAFIREVRVVVPHNREHRVALGSTKEIAWRLARALVELLERAR